MTTIEKITFNKSYFETANMLPEADRYKYVYDLITYGLRGTIPQFESYSNPLAVEMTFMQMKVQIDRETAYTEAQIERGRKGGKSKSKRNSYDELNKLYAKK